MSSPEHLFMNCIVNSGLLWINGCWIYWIKILIFKFYSYCVNAKAGQATKFLFLSYLVCANDGQARNYVLLIHLLIA